MSEPDREAAAALLDRPAVRRLLAVLHGGGEEARLVGGSIRNALLGRPVTEIDLACTALPDVTTRRAEAAGLKVVPTGVEHGTVTVLVEGEGFEVTTLREDVETFGRRAKVRFGRSFEQDALRRDFTINALSLSPDGALHDYAGGLEDLAARRVRFIGDAATRIREDYLRTLRFFRFHAEYAAGPLDPAGLGAAARERAGLRHLSRERVRAELLKLLVARRAAETLADLLGAGFGDAVLGGVGDLGRLSRVAAFEGERAGDPVRRLAALGVLVAEDAPRLQERLRLSNAEADRLEGYAAALEDLKTRRGVNDGALVRALAARHGVVALVDALAAIAGEPRPRLGSEARTVHRRLADGHEDAPAFPLRGGDLIAAGVPPGPRVGELMAEARSAWLAQGCPVDEGAAGRLVRMVVRGNEQSRSG